MTGIDLELVERFAYILHKLTSTESTESTELETFETYTMRTAHLYLRLYPWYYMPLTVYKRLLHGPDVMKHFLLPFEQFFEEVGQARDKAYRNIRKFNSRKFTRVSTNTDLAHKL